MDIQSAVKMLSEEGKSYIIKNDCIKEDVPPHENYYQMKLEEGKWIYSLVIVERKNIPEYKTIKEFNNEEAAAKFLFLDNLSTIYFFEYVSPFIKGHRHLRINRDELNKDSFYQNMAEAHIPSEYVCFDNTKTCNNRIMAAQENDQWILSYRDHLGNEVSSSRPLNGRDANFYLFKAVFLLWLFDTKAKKLLENTGVLNVFSDSDISMFIF